MGTPPATLAPGSCPPRRVRSRPAQPDGFHPAPLSRHGEEESGARPCRSRFGAGGPGEPRWAPRRRRQPCCPRGAGRATPRLWKQYFQCDRPQQPAAQPLLGLPVGRVSAWWEAGEPPPNATSPLPACCLLVAEAPPRPRRFRRLRVPSHRTRGRPRVLEQAGRQLPHVLHGKRGVLKHHRKLCGRGRRRHRWRNVRLGLRCRVGGALSPREHHFGAAPQSPAPAQDRALRRLAGRRLPYFRGCDLLACTPLSAPHTAGGPCNQASATSRTARTTSAPCPSRNARARSSCPPPRPSAPSPARSSPQSAGKGPITRGSPPHAPLLTPPLPGAPTARSAPSSTTPVPSPAPCSTRPAFPSAASRPPAAPRP